MVDGATAVVRGKVRLGHWCGRALAKSLHSVLVQFSMRLLHCSPVPLLPAVAPQARLLCAVNAALSAYVEEKVAEALRSTQTGSGRGSRTGRDEGGSCSSNGSGQQQAVKGDKSGKEE